MSATGKRRKSRELAMQMLFQADMGKQTPDLVRSTFWAKVVAHNNNNEATIA